MPRTGPRRENVIFRLHPEETDDVDKRAAEEGLIKSNGKPNRSEVLRLAVIYYLSKAPKGWRPQ